MSEVLTTDIYDIAGTVLDLQKKFYDDVDEDTLTVSQYGYQAAQFTKVMRNQTILTSEWAKENINTKAQFDSTVLTKSIEFEIRDILAHPAYMDVIISFDEEKLLKAMVNNQITISRSNIINVGDFEYHLDYDILIQSEKLLNGEYIYTARYNMNSSTICFSNITTPWITPPVRMVRDGSNMILIHATISQVSITRTPTSINTNNILANKTVDFQFKDQLAGFEVYVKRTTNGVESSFSINPIYEGLPVKEENYCYYNYLDNNNIRLKFDQDSFNPKAGDIIEVVIYTTEGEAGNFTYSKDEPVYGIISDENDSVVRGLEYYVTTTTSLEGRNKKSIKELQRILPKESFSRGTIATNQDIDNYFNSLNTDNRLIFKKQRHNQQERLYYAYLLAVDDNNNVIPTNTIDLEVYEKDLFMSDNRAVIQPNTLFTYNSKDDYGYMKEDGEFKYTSPFISVINKDPLYVSHYLNIINDDYKCNFNYINQNCFLQFILAKLNINKIYLQDNNYHIKMTVSQNTNINKNLVELDEDGNIIKHPRFKPVLIISPDSNRNYYIYGDVTDFDANTFSYTIEFQIETDNVINISNQIKLKNLYIEGTDEKDDIYCPMNTMMSVAFYANLDNKSYGIDDMIPSLKNTFFTLCTKYVVEEEVALFYNFSSTIRTGVKVLNTTDRGLKYRIKRMPLVRQSYLSDVDRCNKLIDYIKYRKAYIDEAMEVIEQGFEIDMKFYNTYGPSRSFYIGHEESSKLDRVNLTLNFIVSLKQGCDDNIILHLKNDIRDALQDINKITTSIHMSNVCSTIKQKYDLDINFIEFTGVNDYNALYQYINKISVQDTIDFVPEFLNINLKDDVYCDINIKSI